ncbi:MAG: type II toxin-antitoxin system RelE/ParE family toxin [Phycisphaerales bacterium]|jgi:mRNA interferase RelE/StbE|nr:type II toxin-antitoxin system RelE/ParE family toxin [Phycisphaerales bacterium]MBT7171003.1 type II toxin-antitoxin system RelE/ParE family toxin [Phycisphaerales bacterium]
MPRQSEAALSEFRLFETDEFCKVFKKLPAQDRTFLESKLSSFVTPQLKADPFWGANIKKLRGYTPDTWRYRIGKFRVFYIVDQEEKIVYLLTISHRKDAYR